ncbi:receptor-type tyrosine-protein phosphatase N2 [Centruroides vittatus]|uniref:receptor-type tyrosine-protein phosphatase N2 n=1 Tax=Centruroides vittatus TaxID=120091 RepID=UPI0035100B47
MVYKVFVLTYLFFALHRHALAERSVGCLFTSEICEEDELCFDDNVFGRCHEITEDPEERFRYSLTPKTLRLLEHEMKRLFIGGYRWVHNYTQCVIQNILYTERHRLSYDPGLCARLLQMTAPFVPAALLEELEKMDPEDMAYIKFLPSLTNSHSEYADEIFAPARHKPESRFEKRDNDDKLSGKDIEDEDDDDDDDNDKDFLAFLQYLKEASERDRQEDLRYPDNIKDDEPSRHPLFSEGGVEWLPVNRGDDAGWKKEVTSDGDTERKSSIISLRPERWLRNNKQDEQDDGIVERARDEEEQYDDDDDDNFRRFSRYDTKKPGPGFYVHEQEDEPDDDSSWKFWMDPSDKSSVGSVEADEERIDDKMSLRFVGQDSRRINDKEDKEGEKEKGVVPDVGSQYETVDASYTYLVIGKERKLTSSDAEKLVETLEQMLKLPRGIFSNVNVDDDQVTFKVNPNSQGLNASVVANKAEELSEQLKSAVGIEIQGAGIGDKTKFEVVNKTHDRRLFVLTFILCGLIVGIVVAVAVVYLVRKHAKSRKKLQSLAHPETEASQDYQDLCRQRMASKCHEKPEPIHVIQSPKRVSSLSQSETSQPSPSSRSSTSSWSEEPVSSNMDISTGHMILSYMEDHLKNKDRLDREWEALCAYEAEPCSTAIANLPQNVKKNRYPDVVPYDHSRVVLNDLSNVSNEDYINASSITDHDPRNPAYIATQGPLPHTAADFWQMIWEQGNVVIVTLTRLMENGVAMCHRYWPEEGSEVYHMYEVNLVSEHIWCDEYLVRSFYLKNLKTSETRTVTQFHFLAWPENNIPSSTKAILEFRRKVNKSYRGRSCPIVVHCSDGAGRTGTYCLIDMVLNRMSKGAKELDIAATLEHIRDQRGGMVKTKAQFEFVLMAIAEEVHAILKALSH